VLITLFSMRQREVLGVQGSSAFGFLAWKCRKAWHSLPRKGAASEGLSSAPQLRRMWGAGLPGHLFPRLGGERESQPLVPKQSPGWLNGMFLSCSWKAAWAAKLRVNKLPGLWSPGQLSLSFAVNGIRVLLV